MTSRSLRVLFVSSEAAPLIKTGGLADVSAALPGALRRIGVDARLLLPGYPQVLAALPHARYATDLHGFNGLPPARLLAAELPNGVPLWVIECAELYQRGGGPYQDDARLDWPDNAQRFGLLSRVAALLGCADTPLSWHPDVVHCNDWQAGLAPAYLHFARGAAPSMMTIHNLAFQGIFPPHSVQALGLPPACFSPEGVEYYGNLSFLKAGLFYAHHITTVSPTYAQEIQHEPLGFGMQGLLAVRHDQLTGILNGIDSVDWNPATDPHLARNYDAASLGKKAANKRELQKRMGLAVDEEVPLFGVVSRFTYQKGIDVILELLPRLLEMPAQCVLLGSGEAALQQAALDLSHRHRGMLGAYIGFDEALSHLIEAGADMFLMPSRFEPCGLNQMYSQRYGTPPLVHATGGLADSVVDCSAATLADGTASGFMCTEVTPASLWGAVQRAVAAYRDRKTWRAIQKNGMAKDFGWEKSAAEYAAIYRRLVA